MFDMRHPASSVKLRVIFKSFNGQFEGDLVFKYIKKGYLPKRLRTTACKTNQIEMNGKTNDSNFDAFFPVFLHISGIFF